MNTQRFALPPALPTLVEQYAGRRPSPVRFRPPSWEAALADVPGTPTHLLSDPTFTTEPAKQPYRAQGDRLVTTEVVADVCRTLDLTDDNAVVAAFVLVMAWGSGTSNPRSLRNTRSALQNVSGAARMLRDSAKALRAIADIDTDDLAAVHREFSLPGVQEPFFTKWFSFAGIKPERPWQPLILDSRVRATLNRTIAVWLNELTTRRNDPHRYIAYLTALHTWADALPERMTASRLEWIFFTHRGQAL